MYNLLSFKIVGIFFSLVLNYLIVFISIHINYSKDKGNNLNLQPKFLKTNLNN